MNLPQCKIWKSFGYPETRLQVFDKIVGPIIRRYPMYSGKVRTLKMVLFFLYTSNFVVQQ